MEQSLESSNISETSKSSKPSKSAIEKLFAAVQSVVFHLTDKKEYQQAMSVYGLTPKRVQEGNDLLQNAQQCHSAQEGHYDEARRMSSQITEDGARVLDTFKGHVAIARSAFRKEPLVLKELKIQKMKVDRWAWIQQAIDFYEKAPQQMDRLLQFGATQAAFDQNRAAIEALVTLRNRRMQKKGEAEDCTEQKTEAIKELKVWYSEFRKLARMAFKKNPQVLETFGMVVPSARRKKKTEAPQESTEEAK
jgi:hypothetical protein